MDTQGLPVISIKGFDQNLRCRDYQFDVGKTYTHEGSVKVCSSGFHAVEYALDVFGYYPPSDSRYCIVEQAAQVERHDDDTKIVSASITIQAEIKLPQLVQRGVDWIMARVESTKTQTNTGDRSAATNTGHQSAATNTGDRSAATNTGYQSAATNTGDQSAATNTGNRSAAMVEGKHSVAINVGFYGRAKAAKGCAIVLVNRADDGSIRHIRSGIADVDVTPDTWYTLSDDGKFEEVANV